MTELEITKLENKAAKLFGDIRDFMMQSENKSLKDMSSRIPDSLFEKNKKINVVFVGQYSAGKSSILSALTGKKLKIGGGITTDSVSSFDYNGLFVTDTPGVHSQNRPDHDQITYDAIAKADLLVFVVTNEPLGDFMGGHLRRLLFEKEKACETMIVVNKMMDSERGNTPEQQDIYVKGNLNDIISPYTAEDFYTSFIDVNAYNEYLESGDEDDLKDSGFEEFKTNLNRFIEDKNLIGRCSTSLFEVERILENVLEIYSTGDDCVDESIHLLNKKRRELEDAKIQIQEKSRALVSPTVNKIELWGNNIADNLSSGDDQNKVNEMLASRYSDVDAENEKLLVAVENMLGEEADELRKQIKDIDESQLASDLRAKIENKIQGLKLSPGTRDNLGKVSTYSGEVGNWLSKQCIGSNASGQGLLKLSEYSGANAHKVVLKVGHMLGHKFKPWEAVKWTRGLGIAGKCLGVAGAGLGVILQIANDKEAKSVESNLRTARGEIRQCFNDVGNAIEMKYDEATQRWIRDTIEPGIADIDQQLKEINSIINAKNAEYNTCLSLLERTRELIRESHC